MERTIDNTTPAAVLRAVPLLIDFPAQRFWVDYDREADVLYISLLRPQKATDSRMTSDGIILRYRRETRGSDSTRCLSRRPWHCRSFPSSSVSVYDDCTTATVSGSAGRSPVAGS